MIALALLFVFANSHARGAERTKVPDAQRVDEIEFRGLIRTRQEVVVREIPFLPSESPSEQQRALALSRLRNLAMFSDVREKIERRGKRNILIYEFDEIWTLKPVISGQTAGNSYWFIVGASERNFLGRGYFTEVLYQNFNGVSGGRLFFENPRRWNATLERMLRPRIENTVQRTKIRGSLVEVAPDDASESGLAAEVFQDTFHANLSGSTAGVVSPMVGAFLEPWIKWGQWERNRQFRRGLTAEIRPQLGFVNGNGASTTGFFAQMNVTGQWAIHNGKRWNFLARAKLGATPYVPAQMEFYFGGVDYARGYPDNFFQLQEYLLTNTDLRYLLVETKWVALMPFVFFDTINGFRADWNSGGSPQFRTGASVGGGVVLTIPAIADAELRLDISTALKGPYGLSFGFATTTFY